ncbi:hypothetical protein HanRHA438_Chr13g0591751 [Helianthus annuus]|nr:hypothetical protein HanRHA438_Chr13g0591751 [Helianthus annuus]
MGAAYTISRQPGYLEIAYRTLPSNGILLHIYHTEMTHGIRMLEQWSRHFVYQPPSTLPRLLGMVSEVAFPLVEGS